MRCGSVLVALAMSLMLPSTSLADDELNALFVEFFGAGGSGSVNYQRLVGRDWAVQVGAGLFQLSGSNDGVGRHLEGVLSFPTLVEWLGVGNERHRLELGAGLVPLAVFGGEGAAADFPPVVGTAAVGYGLHAKDRLLFRLTFTPLFPGPYLVVEPRAGLSLGARF